MSENMQDRLLELVHASQLKAIEFHEISATQLVPEENAVQPGGDPVYSMRLQHRTGEHDFGTRVIMEVRSEDGLLRIVAAADYETTLESPDEDVIAEFGAEVAVMALVPYLRHTIADMSQRVFGKSLLMPLVRREDIRVGAPGEE